MTLTRHRSHVKIHTFMKLNLLLPATAFLGLAACQNSGGPVSSGDFDPLRPPGSQLNLATADTIPTLRPGQFVETAMDNTAFFKNRPKGNADADKLLNRGVSMKIVQKDASYLKVEIDDTGEVGWVPAVMVVDPQAAPAGLETNPGEFQVYPPPPGGLNTLPLLDPAGQPPAGAIPQIVDPTAPAIIPLDPTTTPPIAPVEVPVEVPVETPATPPVEAPSPLPPSDPDPENP
jgi:hypothetical protein